MHSEFVGRGYGWSIDPDQEADPPTWRWHAYGHRGTRDGTGTNYENCYSQVEAALRELVDVTQTIPFYERAKVG